MPYAVNKTTKAHRAIIQAKHLGADESLLLTDEDGWVTHLEGECPLPAKAPCEYRMRNGITGTATNAANLRWDDTGSDGDVITYRPLPEPVTGLKYDSEKPRYDLLLTGLPLSLEEVTQVLTVGAKKYADNNWQRVNHAETRYMAAAMRHEVAHVQGENRDPETDRYHLAHKICCDLFRLELLMQEEA